MAVTNMPQIVAHAMRRRWPGRQRQDTGQCWKPEGLSCLRQAISLGVQACQAGHIVYVTMLVIVVCNSLLPVCLRPAGLVCFSNICFV